MSALSPNDDESIRESGIGAIEVARDSIRPEIFKTRPLCNYVPRKLKSPNLDLESLDKFVIGLKGKMSRQAALDAHEQFKMDTAPIVEDIHKIKADIEGRLEKLDKHESPPVVTVPEPGIARVEIKIDDNTAWFEVSCDTENCRFKGIRCEPVVEDFETLASEQPILNELIDTMTRRFKKVLRST